jgi:exosortase
VLNREILALALKVSTLTAATIAIYFQDLSIVFKGALTNEATSHILLVPILFAYLLYRKRKMLRTAVTSKNENVPANTRYVPIGSGIVLSVIAVLLYWYGSYTFMPLEYHVLTLPIFTAGLTLIFFNIQTLRQALFPIIFLAFLVPPPSQILYTFGATLSVIGTEASNGILNLVGIRSTITSPYGTPTINIIRANGAPMAFNVDIACSGIYSLIGFLIFGAFIAYIVRDKTWKKGAILLIGFPLIYLLNIFRIASTVLIGYQWGQELALNVFHLLGGWVLIFIGTLILLVVTENALKIEIFTKKTQNHCSTCNPRPPDLTETYCFSCGRLLRYPQVPLKKSDAAKIAITIIMAVLLISIQTPVFALVKGPSQILVANSNGQQGNTEILPQISSYQVQFAHRDTDFENLSGQDLSLLYAYEPEQIDMKTVWVALEIAETTGSLHNWEICLITWPLTHGYQPTVRQLDLRDTTIQDNPPLIGRYFAFQYQADKHTQLVLYWYESAVFTINNETQQKMLKTSLIVYPDKPKDVPALEEQLLSMAKTIAGYWQPIKTWSTLAMLMSQNGNGLVMVATGFLFALIIFYTFQASAQKTANANIYRKLSKPNQQVVNIIQKTEKHTNPTLAKIHERYEQTTGQRTDPQQLEQKLTELAKTGVIEESIVNNQDEPTRIWKIEMTTGSHEHNRLDRWKQIITSRLK